MGWLDVDAMLAQMTPEQFRERMAADVLDPINETWEQSGTIAATIHNEVQRIVSGMTQTPMKDADVHTSRQYQPVERIEEETPKPSTDDDLRAFVASAESVAGHGH